MVFANVRLEVMVEVGKAVVALEVGFDEDEEEVRGRPALATL